MNTNNARVKKMSNQEVWIRSFFYDDNIQNCVIIDVNNNEIFISGFNYKQMESKIKELNRLINIEKKDGVGIVCDISYSFNVERYYLTGINSIIQRTENQLNNQNEESIKQENKEGENREEGELSMKNEVNEIPPKEITKTVDFDDFNNIKIEETNRENKTGIEIGIKNRTETEKEIKNKELSKEVVQYLTDKITYDDLLKYYIDIYNSVNKISDDVITRVNDNNSYWKWKTAIEIFGSLIKSLDAIERIKKSEYYQDKMEYDVQMLEYYKKKLNFDEFSLDIGVRETALKLSEKIIGNYDLNDLVLHPIDHLELTIKISSIIEKTIKEGYGVGIELIEEIKKNILNVANLKVNNERKNQQEHQQKEGVGTGKRRGRPPKNKENKEITNKIDKSINNDENNKNKQVDEDNLQQEQEQEEKKEDIEKKNTIIEKTEKEEETKTIEEIKMIEGTKTINSQNSEEQVKKEETQEETQETKEKTKETQNEETVEEIDNNPDKNNENRKSRIKLKI